MADHQFKVEVTSRDTIKPSSPTPPHLKTLQPSLIDQQFAPRVYTPFTLFYPNEPTHPNHDDLTCSTLLLKRSLSDVLVHFYPLAGRIQDDSSIDCNDEGVEFLEAQVSSDLSEVVENPISENLEKLLPFKPIAHLNKATLLGVQVNRFACGGMSVSVCISHKIADGTAMVDFIKAWAATVAAAGGGDSGPVATPRVSFNGASYFPPKAVDSTVALEDLICIEEKIVAKRFVFDEKAIGALKERAGGKVKGPTRVEAVSAFVWRRFLEQAARGGAKPSAMHAVNLRPRMVPPLPEGSFGNLIWMAVAPPPPPSAEGDDPNYNHAELASKLREAIRSLSTTNR